jgi:hypothetical protein
MLPKAKESILCLLRAAVVARCVLKQHDDKAQEGRQGEVVYPTIVLHVSAAGSK